MNGIILFYFLFFGVSLCVFFLGLEPNTCMLFLQHHTFILVKSCRFDFSTRYIYIYICRFSIISYYQRNNAHRILGATHNFEKNLLRVRHSEIIGRMFRGRYPVWLGPMVREGCAPCSWIGMSKRTTGLTF